MDTVLARLNAMEHDGAEEVTQRVIDPTMLSNSEHNQALRDDINGAMQQDAANDPQFAMQQSQAAHAMRQQAQPNQQLQQQPVQQQQAQAIAPAQQNQNNVTKKQNLQNESKRNTQKQQQQQNFNKMLNGTELASMRGSLNKKTSGNFDAGAPNSAAKVVADQLRAGQRAEKKAAKQEKRTQKQENRAKKLDAQRQQAEQKQSLPKNKKGSGTGLG